MLAKMSANSRTDDNCISVYFRLAYMTVWGQHIRVLGEHRALGDWDAVKAPALACRHVGEELVWEGQVSLPKVTQIAYKFAVVTADQRVEEIERGSRTVHLPSSLHAGAVISLQDEWQVGLAAHRWPSRVFEHLLWQGCNCSLDSYSKMKVEDRT